MEPICNPYSDDGKTWDSCIKVSGRVSPADYAFLKRTFPLLNGLQDKLVSSLYKILCDELRRINSTTPIEPGWSLDSDAYAVLADVLRRLEARSRLE